MSKPKHHKDYLVSDRGGHYDMDGVTQAPDYEVVVAGDETPSNKPSHSSGLSRVKHKIKNWFNKN